MRFKKVRSSLHYPFSTLLLLFTLPGLSAASIINIPDDAASIQSGINLAAEGDTVLVQPGTWQELIDFDGREITVASLWLTSGDTAYVSSTIIDGNADGCVVTFLNNETASALLCGFTITGGAGYGFSPDYLAGGITCRYGASPTLRQLQITGNLNIGDYGYGGGIVCSDSADPLIENVVLTGNEATYGGAISVIDAMPMLQDVVMNGNSAHNGGALYCSDNAAPVLIDALISGNYSYGSEGGGVFCEEQATPHLSGVQILNNAADWNGGGLSSRSGAWPELVEVIFHGNSAGHSGGAVYCENGQVDLTECLVTDNTGFIGAGIYGRDEARMKLEGVLFSGNHANVDGGAVYCDNARLELSQVTITGNSAAWDGGAAYFRSTSELELNNCILWNNQPQQVYCPEFGELSTITVNCSDIEGGQEGMEVNDNCIIFWMDNNLTSDPLFCDPANDDFRLDPASPCRTTDCGYMGYTAADCEGEPASSPALPLEIRISRIYPNPFNSSARIEFELSVPRTVQLTIHNLLGQQVALLAQGHYSAGLHEVCFNSEQLASGVYFCRLEAGDQLLREKLLLVR